MSKNSKKNRVSVRNHHVSARRNLHEDDGWPEERACWDSCCYTEGEDPEAEEILWDAFIQVYSLRERLVVKTIYRCWEFWMDVPQRALMVHDAIATERWMLLGLPKSEQLRRAQASARAIWEVVLNYSDPSKHRELDLEDVLDHEECNNFCRDDRDQCLEEIETTRRKYAHCLERVSYERC